MNASTIDSARTADREIVATRLFDAPRDLVWAAWTDPNQIAQWWGPKGFTNTITEMNVRPGGVWRFVMHGPDGRDYDNEIVYAEVVMPERLVYDHGPAPRFRVTATFEPRGAMTSVTVRMLFESAALRDGVAKAYGAIEGLQQTLDRLAAHLTTAAEERVVEITRDAPSRAPRAVGASMTSIGDRFAGWAPRILGAARILAGIMFASHGAQKLLGAFGGMPPGVPRWIVWTAGPIELVGGSLIALGLFTRPVAFLASGLMAVAYFVGHARNGFWPKINGGELAILYCWLFLYLAANGPGAWALDNLLRRRQRVP